MAGKTLIGGTGYGITGGKILKDGVSYSVKNGKVLVNGTAYDILFGSSGGLTDVFWADHQYTQINCICYANGYWVLGGERYNETTNQYAAIVAYATSPSGPWTVTNMWSSTSKYQTINCVAYANGCWVAAGSKYYSAYLAYRSNTSPEGEWTLAQVSNNSSGGRYSKYWITCLTYANNYWVLGGESDDSTSYGTIWYSKTPSSEWSIKTIYTNSSSSTDKAITDIAYLNGYWIVCGQYYSSSATSHYIKLAYSTSLTGTWTTKNLNSSYSISSPAIIYDGSYYVIAGRDYYSSGSSSGVRIYYSTSLTASSWSSKQIWDGADTHVECFTYANGYYVAGGTYYDGIIYYARIAYATSLTGTWTTMDLWGGTTGDQCIYDISYDNELWVVGGTSYNPNEKRFYGRIVYAPTIGGLYDAL